MRIPDDDAKSFNISEKNNERYWRAVLISWYGVPLNIETPVYPYERLKERSGHGKAKIVVVGKFLGIIYKTKNKRVCRF